MLKNNLCKSYVIAMRLERWPRSLAIIVGFAAFFILYQNIVMELHFLNIAAYLFVGYMLTFMISMANYIINEIADAPYDAHHPHKKNRPLINKEVNRYVLMTLWFLLVLIPISVSYLMLNNIFILFALIALLISGILYNVPPVRIKDIPYLDSTLESLNNPIRLLIGWYMFTSVLPPILLLFSWWAFGNFLMMGKRVAEKKFLTDVESSGYRHSLQKYTLTGMKIFLLLNALIFVITFCLFALESKRYSFLYTIPVIIIYLLLFTKKFLQDLEGAEEPENLLKNPWVAFYTIILIIVFIIASLCR